MDMYIHIRIDLQHPFFHHIRFIFSYGFSRSNNLTVQIGQAYLIIIDQIKGSDTASHQCLTDISADTADTKNSHS